MKFHFWVGLVFVFTSAACNKGVEFRRITPVDLGKPKFEAPTTTTTTTSSTTTTQAPATTTSTSTTTTTTRPTVTSTTTTSTTTTTSRSTTTSSTTTTSTSSTTTTTRAELQARERFWYAPTQDVFQQQKYDQNVTTAVFRATDSFGRSIPNLTEPDFEIHENGTEVKNFKIIGSNSVADSEVDIVFTLDITGSMDEEINSIKLAIRGFVSQLASRRVKARLCVVTFKDEVVDRCRRFVEDDPTTTKNENLDWFEDFLTRLDPDGGDLPKENSLGGLVTAIEETPWGANRQRVVILFTDIAFWIQPLDYKEREARFAPTYDRVMSAVQGGQAMVFPVTPKMNAFATNYFSKPSIPKMSNGQWFDLRKLEKGQTTMDEIFTKIGQKIETNYALEYIVEDNPGLDPSLPLSQRKLSIVPKAPSTINQIAVLKFDSNLPSGRPQYLARFPLRPGVKASTLAVTLNGTLLSSGFKLEGSDLVFPRPPAPGSVIGVTYEVGRLRDNLVLRAVVLPGAYQPKSVRLYLNGQLAKSTDYRLSKTPTGEWLLDLTDEPFVESDPYNIRGLGVLDVLVYY